MLQVYRLRKYFTLDALPQFNFKVLSSVQSESRDREPSVPVSPSSPQCQAARLSVSLDRPTMATIPRRETCAVTTWGTGRGGQVQSGNREDKRTLLNAKVAAQFRVVWDREHCRKLTCQGGGEDLVKVACVDLSEDVVLNVSLTRRHAPPPARAEPLLEIETLSNSRQDYRAEIRADILDEERSVVPAAHLYIPQTHLVHGRKDILWTEWNAVLQRFQRGSHFHVVLAITLAPVDGSDLAAETIRKHEEIYSRRKSSSPKHAQPPPPRAPFGLQVLGGLVSEGMADSTIVCGQRSWPAHSFILKLRSPVFAKMLESNFRDRNAKCLDLTYWEKMPPASAVDAFVAFVNEDNRSGIEEHAMSLLSIAHMYEVISLHIIHHYFFSNAFFKRLTTLNDAARTPSSKT